MQGIPTDYRPSGCVWGVRGGCVPDLHFVRLRKGPAAAAAAAAAAKAQEKARAKRWLGLAKKLLLPVFIQPVPCQRRSAFALKMSLSMTSPYCSYVTLTGKVL